MAVTLKGQTAVYEGTSTDTKPTDADNNAIFKELDTGIRYYYDGTNWNEIPSSGGGGGGGTGTDNYNDLNNKPSINGTTLSGNKSLDNLGIQAKLTFDSAPTEGSENPVESGGVYSALAGKQDALSSEQLDAVNSGVTSADVEQITTNKNNILLKADKIRFGFSGNPNPAVYEKDWDFVPDGIYLLAYLCSQDASTRRGVSVYMFTKYTTNHIVLFTPVVEVSGATITSCVASGSAGAETITFTLAQRGYHTFTAIQVTAF